MLPFAVDLEGKWVTCTVSIINNKRLWKSIKNISDLTINKIKLFDWMSQSMVSTFSVAANVRCIVFFTVPHHLFYRQKIGGLIWFWQKSGLECTKYSISPHIFRGGLLTFPFQWRRATSVSAPPSPPPSSNAVAMASQCFYRPPQVSRCLLFVRGCLLHTLLERPGFNF